VQLQQNELDAARLRLQQHQLRAPFAGIVVLVRGRIGEWVEVGVPVLRLVAVDKLRAEGFLQVGQATADLVGRPVQIEFGSAAKRVQVTGILRFVSPEMDPVTKQVRIWAEVPNADGLLCPGQQGTLEILP
jgi:macrolide-specific efflux system membrane fusion protein